MLDPVAYLHDRTDPRVLAAVARKCPASTCLVPSGEWCRGTVFVVHQIRVPESELVRWSA